MTTNDSNQLIYSVAEAADVLRLGMTATYELISTKQLVSIKVGRRRLITHEDLTDFIRAQRREEAA